MSEPAITILLPTVGRSRRLLPLLDQIQRQAGPNDEILVIDQSEPDEHRLIACHIAAMSDCRFRLRALAKRSLPGARNAGIAAALAPIIAFFDDDTELLPGCLDAHRSAYEDPSVGGVAGRILEQTLRPNARYTVNRVDRGGRIRVNLEGRDPCEIDSVKGANMSFRKVALDQLSRFGEGEARGPFDPGYGGTALLEEADVSARLRALGWRLRFVPGASVIHHHERTGGVRTSAPDGDWWRLHNTARYLRRHRGAAALLPFAATSALLAWKRAAVSRDLGALVKLFGAARAGWRSGRIQRPP